GTHARAERTARRRAGQRRTADRGTAARGRRSGLVAGRRAFVVLAVVDIAVGPAIAVPVGPDGAGETADRRADGGPGKHVAAGNRGNARAARGADDRSGNDRRN